MADVSSYPWRFPVNSDMFLQSQMAQTHMKTNQKEENMGKKFLAYENARNIPSKCLKNVGRLLWFDFNYVKKYILRIVLF